MAVKIIGLVIGILILGAGVYYLVKEKQDPESKKIYTVVSVIGAAVAVVCILVALGLLMSLTGWVKQDLSQSLMSLINTVVSVALHPVGDAVIQLS